MLIKYTLMHYFINKNKQFPSKIEILVASCLLAFSKYCVFIAMLMSELENPNNHCCGLCVNDTAQEDR